MKRTAVAAIFGSLMVIPAAHAQLKDAAVVVAQTDAVVTVTKVDAKARTVTFRGPKGGLATLDIPPEAQNLDRVKPGQQYRMKYVEAVAVSISKGGAPEAVAVDQVKLAPKGANPGGVIARAQQISGVVDAIDYTDRYVAVRGPKGNILTLRVADDVALEELAAGDRIALTYSQALAVEMVAQPPAKKAK